MPTNDQNKCAHLPCRCSVQPGNKYCGKEVEIACQCDHGPCPLTV
jgi:hypothetical protein